MTAIFLSDTFYLIDNMSMDEVIGIASSEGLSSPKIRAKAVMHMNTEFYSPSRIKDFLPSITMGFYETGNSFIMKPIMGVNDLEYFVGPDGRKYTCEAEYHNSPYRFVGVNQEIRDENIADLEQLSEEASAEVSEQSLIIVPRVASVPELKPVDTVYVPPALPPAATHALVPNTPIIDNSIDKKEKIEHAEFLDVFLSKYPHISLYVKGDALTEVEDYLSECKEDLDREVKMPFLEAADVLKMVDGDLGEYTIDNAVGTSSNMLDSLLTFPVFSAIIGKKKLTEKFSLLNLPGSQFIRICPVGVSQSGELYGFVHMEEISVAAAQKAESEIRQMLKNSGQNFNKMSAHEKYKLFEEKICDYYTKSSGKMLRASGSQKYVNIVEFLNNMSSKRYLMPDFYDDNEGMVLWPSHETITFDNRASKKLKQQLEEKFELGQNISLGEIDSGTPKFIQSGEETSDVLPGIPMGANADISNSALLEAMATSSPVGGDNLSVVSGEGETINNIKINHRIIPEIKTPRVIHLPGQIDDTYRATMGGVDPLNPTKYVDDEGREWESKEAYLRIMEKIFGEQTEETEIKKK